MEQYLETISARRSFYHLSDQSPISDDAIQRLIETAILHVPTAYNMQQSTAVLLLGEHHTALWDIVKSVLKERIGPERFVATKEKIDTSFASGYGTVLFFNDQQVLRQFSEDMPRFSDNFTLWAQQSAGMLQHTIWVGLEDAGFGASLQHYNPIIDDEVKTRWSLPEHWQLLAQMPFGIPLESPGEKEFRPLEERFQSFR